MPKLVKIREFTIYFFCDFPFENERFEVSRKSAKLNWDPSFRWSFGPFSAWGSIESTTILTTNPSLLIAQIQGYTKITPSLYLR